MKKKNQKTATSYDVAKAANVSQSTVSRVFSSKWNDKIKPETRNHIIRISKELGYKPNAIAKSLYTDRTWIVGIAIPESISVFFSLNLRDFTSKFKKIGFKSLVFTISPYENADSSIEEMLKYRVDAILLISCVLSETMVDECYKMNTPVVIFNRKFEDKRVSVVYRDAWETGKIAAEFLLSTGHKEIAYITPRNSPFADTYVYDGFIERLLQLGIDKINLENGNYLYDSGFEAAKRLFDKNPNIDAVFCACDAMAIGAMDYIKFVLNKKIPEDVSIIGIDDIEESSRLSNRLTTFRYPRMEMIDQTVDILKEQVNQNLAPINLSFKMNLIVRDTVKK